MGVLGATDLAVVGAYLAGSLWLGARSVRAPAERTEDYLLAGRTLTLPAFVVTLVCTWYGGVLGVGEYSYLHGLSNWLVLGVPYYIGALLFALLFAGRARAIGEYTVPDVLFDTYGRGAGAVGTVAVLAVALPAPYLLMMGVILPRALGIGKTTAVVAAAVLAAGTVVLRGFRSVVRTKGLQFALMYGGFVLLLPIAVASSGGPLWLRDHVPPVALTALGGQSLGYVLAWYLIALQTLVEPTFFQRCFAARSPRTARLGVLVSIFFFAVFDGLTTLTGLYARALVPDIVSAVDAYPALAELLLPVGLLGVFYAGMIATVMSTVDSFLFVGAVTIGRDLVWRLSGGRVDQTLWTRIGLALSTVLAAAIALQSESVVALWYGFGSLATVVLLLPLLGAFYPALRPPRRIVAPAMVVSGGTTLVWMLGSHATGGGPWLGIEPIYPGLGLAVALYAAGIGVAARSRRSRR